MKDNFKHKKIVITGGAGTVGSELTFQLQKFNPKRIVLLDNSEYGIHKLLQNPRYDKKTSKVILVDIKNYIHLKSVLIEEKPDIIIHAAAYKHLPILQENPSEAILTNVLATKNLVELVKEIKPNKFLFISTDKAVTPSSNLGISKYLAERLIISQELSKTQFYVVRFGNILRSSGSVSEVFEGQIKNKLPLTVTDFNVKRFFIKLENACQLLLETLAIEVNRGVFIFKMGEPQKVIDLAKEIANSNKLDLYNDIKVYEIGLKQGEKLNEVLHNEGDKLIKTKHNRILQVIEKSSNLEINGKIDEMIELSKNRMNSMLSQQINEIIKSLRA